MVQHSMVSCSDCISPEYAIDGLYSIKSDVFSLGVLVLEMVNGNRNRGFSHPDHNLNLLGHVSLRMETFSYFDIPNLLLITWFQLSKHGDYLQKAGLLN